MKDIKNLNGKLVCRIDEIAGVVEIVQKGYKTLVLIKPDGTFEVRNY